MGIAEHLSQIGICVFDLASNRVKQQDPNLRGFKYAAIAGLRSTQRAISGCRRGADERGGHEGGAVPICWIVRLTRYAEHSKANLILIRSNWGSMESDPDGVVNVTGSDTPFRK
jgi:hypothetical protein